VIGRALCSFTIANHTMMTPFYVVRDLVGAPLLRMPYLTQAGVIIHAATHEIEFANDERIIAQTSAGADVAAIEQTSVTRYDCSVSTVCSIESQPLVTYAILQTSVRIPPCTGQLAEASVPTNRSVHGCAEPAEDVERDSGLLISRLFIADNVATKGVLKL
jgi:hypothetical protein